MHPQLILPDHGLYYLWTRRGNRLLASIPTPRGATTFMIYVIFSREEVRELFAQLRADPESIPDSEYLTDDDFFETPDGPAYRVAGSDVAKLDDLLYRDPTADDPGGWLRRELTQGAKARGGEPRE